MEKPHFDKLVGVKAMNLPLDVSKEEAEQIISETLQDKGGEFIEGLELEKTEKDKEIIELADQVAENYLRQFGRENIPDIPLDNIHLLREGGTEVILYTRRKKAIESIKKSQIQAENFFISHLKCYQLQIHK